MMYFLELHERWKFEPAGPTGSLAKVDWYRSDFAKFFKFDRFSKIIRRRRLKSGSMISFLEFYLRCKFERAGQTGSLAKVDRYRTDIGKFSKVGLISEVIIRRRLTFGSMF